MQAPATTGAGAGSTGAGATIAAAGTGAGAAGSRSFLRWRFAGFRCRGCGGFGADFRCLLRGLRTRGFLAASLLGSGFCHCSGFYSHARHGFFGACDGGFSAGSSGLGSGFLGACIRRAGLLCVRHRDIGIAFTAQTASAATAATAASIAVAILGLGDDAAFGLVQGEFAGNIAAGLHGGGAAEDRAVDFRLRSVQRHRRTGDRRETLRTTLATTTTPATPATAASAFARIAFRRRTALFVARILGTSFLRAAFLVPAFLTATFLRAAFATAFAAVVVASLTVVALATIASTLLAGGALGLGLDDLFLVLFVLDLVLDLLIRPPA